MNVIGKNIRKLRQQNGWSQGDVAKRLNISIPAFSKIETGITDINISRLQQIAELYRVSLVDILCNEEDHPTNVSNARIEDLVIELAKSKQDIISMQKKLIKLFDENRALQLLNGSVISL